jgi:hypothetical protein
MKPFISFALALAAGVAILGLGAAPAFAQTRVFVSGSGSDANPCSLAAPCRSFQQAHNTVATGGEIVALDAAGYGPLTISKSVTVTAIGIEASITSSSTSPFGITINAGPNDVVAIRGLTLLSGFSSGDGIDIDQAKSVTLRDCTITGFPGHGIKVEVGTALSLELRDVTSNNNKGNGLELFPIGFLNLKVLATDSSFNGNGGAGIGVDGQNNQATLTATFSITAADNVWGIFAQSASGFSQPAIMVTGSKLVNNGTGLQGHGNVRMFVDRTQISGNAGSGWLAETGAFVYSYKNNAVNGNADDGFNGVIQLNSE